MVHPLHHGGMPMLRFLRSLLAGGAATLVDLAVLTALVAGLHLSPRVANVPALVAGGVVAFVGNRCFAFRATGGRVGEQVALFALVEILALAWNGLLFDLGVRALANHPLHAHPLLVPALRIVTSHLVFVAWSYPLWRFVFRRPTTAR